MKYSRASIQQSLGWDLGYYRHILASVANRTRSGGSPSSFTAADMVRNYKTTCTLCMWAKKYPTVWVGSREEEEIGFFVDQSAPNSRDKKPAVVFPGGQNCLWNAVQKCHCLSSRASPSPLRAAVGHPHRCVPSAELPLEPAGLNHVSNSQSSS